MRPFVFYRMGALYFYSMKNTQLLLWGGALLAVVAGLIFVTDKTGGSAPQTAYSASVLSALTDAFDFGTINMRDGTVAHSFPATNTGREPVSVSAVYTSCMCTTAVVTDKAGTKSGPYGMPGHASPRAEILIGGGETVSVEAIFDPAAHGPSGVGLAERSIYLETDSVENPVVELKFRAVVTR